MMSPKPSDATRRHNAVVALLTVLVLAACTLASCGSNGCEETRESYCLAEFKATSGASVTMLYVWGIGQMGQRELQADSVVAYHPETGVTDTTLQYTWRNVDSLMYSTSTPDNLELMLRPDTTETRLRLLFTAVRDGVMSQVADTLTLRYTPQPYFINMDCGCTINYVLHELNTTTHFVQNATIVNDEITHVERLNLHIEY